MTQLAIAVPGDQGADERVLVDRARHGDREAEYALYRRHAPRLHRLVYRLCGDEDLTNDLVQDAFVRAFGKLERFRGDSAFGTWLHRIAVNLTLNARRSERRREQWFRPIDGVDGESDERPRDPDLAESIDRAVGQLTEGQRTVFVMHAMEGYTHVEISEVLGISEGTSKGRLFHARARLRELLARFAPE